MSFHKVNCDWCAYLGRWEHNVLRG